MRRRRSRGNGPRARLARAEVSAQAVDVRVSEAVVQAALPPLAREAVGADVRAEVREVEARELGAEALVELGEAEILARHGVP